MVASPFLLPAARGLPGVPGAVELADDVGGEGVALGAGAQRARQFQERVSASSRALRRAASRSARRVSIRVWARARPVHKAARVSGRLGFRRTRGCRAGGYVLTRRAGSPGRCSGCPRAIRLPARANQCSSPVGVGPGVPLLAVLAGADAAVRSTSQQSARALSPGAGSFMPPRSRSRQPARAARGRRCSRRPRRRRRDPTGGGTPRRGRGQPRLAAGGLPARRPPTQRRRRGAVPSRAGPAGAGTAPP